jgi:LPXTG-site transpeptidase (sortase) family protein
MPATRIRIPALDLDSRVAELAVVRTDDSASWETPKHVVGHIPTTANAGSGGQGWYFGHLESPIRGEGSVFRRLPEVAALLKEDPDRPVYVFLESGDRSFAYRIYNVEVVSQEELAIADSGTQDITLVTCTPRFVYDQRLLVTAALVGVLES